MNDPPLVFTVFPGEHPEMTILTLIGPLTLYNLFAFQDQLRAVETPVTILDLEQMTYMDSAGLGLLVNGFVSAQRRGREFLVTGVNERVGALLSLTHVDKVLAMYPSVDDAEEYLRALR